MNSFYSDFEKLKGVRCTIVLRGGHKVEGEVLEVAANNNRHEEYVVLKDVQYYPPLLQKVLLEEIACLKFFTKMDEE